MGTPVCRRDPVAKSRVAVQHTVGRHCAKQRSMTVAFRRASASGSISGRRFTWARLHDRLHLLSMSVVVRVTSWPFLVRPFPLPYLQRHRISGCHSVPSVHQFRVSPQSGPHFLDLSLREHGTPVAVRDTGRPTPPGPLSPVKILFQRGSVAWGMPVAADICAIAQSHSGQLVTSHIPLTPHISLPNKLPAFGSCATLVPLIAHSS